MSTMRARLVLGDGREVLCDLDSPGDADGLLRFIPREPVTVGAGESFTLRLNVRDEP